MSSDKDIDRRKSVDDILLSALENSRLKLADLSTPPGKKEEKKEETKTEEKEVNSPESTSSSNASSNEVILEIHTKNLNLTRNCSMGDLIMAPSNDSDQIHNLNALLVNHKNSIKFDSKCFEIMYNKAVLLNKWVSRFIYLTIFITLLLGLAGVAKINDMQPYIVGTITLIFGMNGYKDHEHLESGVQALDQCNTFTNEMYNDINYFLYRSNHSIEALNVFVSAIDDKLKIFDRTTRLPIPINIKSAVLDLIKIEKEESKKERDIKSQLESIIMTPSVHDNQRSLYKVKKHRRHHSAEK